MGEDMAGKLKNNDVAKKHGNHRLDSKTMCPVSHYPKYFQNVQTLLSSLHPA